jgi:hypothetical protein
VIAAGRGRTVATPLLDPVSADHPQPYPLTRPTPARSGTLGLCLLAVIRIASGLRPGRDQILIVAQPPEPFQVVGPRWLTEVLHKNHVTSRPIHPQFRSGIRSLLHVTPDDADLREFAGQFVRYFFGAIAGAVVDDE